MRGAEALLLQRGVREEVYTAGGSVQPSLSGAYWLTAG